ncbi:hypothetical protein HDU76_002331 [Blyttiomyces sp. JEL0837]|nr:hypothetical protein HDU76_002331 [Blyttiomyces sp. JEL0837]
MSKSINSISAKTQQSQPQSTKPSKLKDEEYNYAGTDLRDGRNQQSQQTQQKPQQIALTEDDFEENTWKQKLMHAIDVFFAYMCCCVPNTKMARFVCCGVTLAIFAILFAVGWLFWPRFPEIHVVSLDLEGDHPYSFYTDPGSANLNTLTLELRLIMNISAYNPNLYDLSVDTLNLNAWLYCNMSDIAVHDKPASYQPLVKLIGPAPVNPDPYYKPSTEPKIGSGNRTNLFFPSKKNSTFQMEFLFKYHPDTEVGLILDPALAEVFRACGVIGTRRPTRIDYLATSSVNRLQAIGYAPTVQNYVLINCPATDRQIQELANPPEGLTGVQILEGVFGNGSGGINVTVQGGV